MDEQVNKYMEPKQVTVKFKRLHKDAVILNMLREETSVNLL